MLCERSMFWSTRRDFRETTICRGFAQRAARGAAPRVTELRGSTGVERCCANAVCFGRHDATLERPLLAEASRSALRRTPGDRAARKGSPRRKMLCERSLFWSTGRDLRETALCRGFAQRAARGAAPRVTELGGSTGVERCCANAVCFGRHDATPEKPLLAEASRSARRAASYPG